MKALLLLASHKVTATGLGAPSHAAWVRQGWTQEATGPHFQPRFQTTHIVHVKAKERVPLCPTPHYISMVEWWLFRKYSPELPVLLLHYNSANFTQLKID